MARTYKRDARGRFAGGGGSSSGRPKARMQERGRNRLTRDNAGRIQGIGGSGATARGGRLRTASGKQRGAVLMKAQGQGRLRGGKGGGGGAVAVAGAKVAAVKAKAKGVGIGGSKAVIKKFRSQVPATTTNYKQALPVSSANRPRLERANNIKQRATSLVSFSEMQKLRIKAGVANNPNSSMSKAERTKARNALANAELQNRKKEKSYGIAARAAQRYTNVAGYTQGEGRTKWRRAGQRSTVFGAGAIRGGPRRNLTRQSPAPRSPQPAQRRRRARAWYEGRR